MVHKIEAYKALGYFPLGFIRANKDAILICGEGRRLAQTSDLSRFRLTLLSYQMVESIENLMVHSRLQAQLQAPYPKATSNGSYNGNT